MGQRKVIIVGAGISGLSLGWALKGRFGTSIELSLLEKSASPGGWIVTQRGDFLFEKGPRGVRPTGNGVATVKLIDQLGLQDEVIEAKTKRRFLLQRDQLVSPFSFSLLKEAFVRQQIKEDESIYDFACRRFGKNHAEKLFNAMTVGVFAGDPKKLSLKACFPTFYEWEKTHGSIIWGMLFAKKIKSRFKTSLISFKKGMQTLVDVLAHQLTPLIQCNKEVVSYKKVKNEWHLYLEGGEVQSADTVIFATPTPLPGRSEKIPTQSLDVVCLGWEGKCLAKSGFGYLVPTSENEKILGAVFDSSVFPQQNINEQTRITVMLQSQSGDPISIAQEAIFRHLKTGRLPDVVYHFSAPKAIAQYERGYHTKISDIEKKAGGVHCIGSHFHGVAVNDCIQKAFDFVKTF